MSSQNLCIRRRFATHHLYHRHHHRHLHLCHHQHRHCIHQHKFVSCWKWPDNNFTISEREATANVDERNITEGRQRSVNRDYSQRLSLTSICNGVMIVKAIISYADEAHHSIDDHMFRSVFSRYFFAWLLPQNKSEHHLQRNIVKWCCGSMRLKSRLASEKP